MAPKPPAASTTQEILDELQRLVAERGRLVDEIVRLTRDLFKPAFESPAGDS